MTEFWFHERVETGWEVRDENRLLVAQVVDFAHEREDDANLIVAAPGVAERHERLLAALRMLRESIETDIESLRGQITKLVDALQTDARIVHAQYAARGADAVGSSVIETHACELGRVQAELDRKRLALHALERAMEAGS